MIGNALCCGDVDGSQCDALAMPDSMVMRGWPVIRLRPSLVDFRGRSAPGIRGTGKSRGPGSPPSTTGRVAQDPGVGGPGTTDGAAGAR